MTDLPPASAGRTRLDRFEFTATDRGAPEPAADARWWPAVVPGGVHEGLLAGGEIEDPYYDRNEADVRWIEDRDWWYRTTFPGPADLLDGQRLRLVCHGLDTVATLWLNGALLGRHENMFRPAEFDLTGSVRPSNRLVIRFEPPLSGLQVPESVGRLQARLAQLLGAMATDPATGEPTGGPMTTELGRATQRRKAAFSWGWDFGPRVPSIGIWRPVDLVREHGAALTGHHIRTRRVDRAAGTAEVDLAVTVDAFAYPGPLRAVVTLTAPDGRATTAAVDLPAGDRERMASTRVTVADAHLWWTHDLGEPAGYDVRVELRDDRPAGPPLDLATDRTGLRTIVLDRSPDEADGGRRFRFILNGVPVFARGANWIPASLLVGSVTADRYRDLVTTARDGNMNMLRVWGGGVYEHDSFYRACDELGVLLWHDFMFACIDYPSDDPALRHEVQLEAEYQVTRLRNHPSLALWCGNNEVQMVHQMVFGDLGPGNWGHGFFHELLPATVARYSPEVPYWPGSPYGQDDPKGVNGVLDGDRHAWEVWHGADFGAGGGPFASRGEAMHFARYASDRGKFVSEFGIHAAPELATLRRWIPAESLTVHSGSFDHHNKDNPKNKGDDLLAVETGRPDGIEQYVAFTMAAQAEGLKFGIEHYRNRQPHANGTLVWQFNDVWPGFSWSIVDYDRVPKAGYYAARRAFSPVLASFRRAADGRVELWLANSTADPVDVTAVLDLATFRGETIATEEVRVSVGPARAALAWTSVDPVAATDRYAWVRSPDGRFPDNRLFFAPIKDLPIRPGSLDLAVTPTGDGATLTLTAHGYSYLAHIPSPGPGVRFSDNYLDLRDGQTATIRVDRLPAGFDPARLRAASYPWLATREAPTG